MSTADSIPPLDNKYGCLVLALAFTMALWGTGTLQLYFFYDRYWGSDKLWLKLYVIIIWALDTVHQAFIVQVVYTALVTNFADPSSIGKMDWTMISIIILTTFTSALVQVLFIHKIWRLSKHNWILTGAVAALVVSSTVPSIVFYAKAQHLTNTDQLHSASGLEHVYVVTAAVTDVSITAILVYLLQSRRTGFKKTNTIVNRIIVYTVNTGLIPGLCAIVSMIFCFVAPWNYIYIMFYFMVSQLYLNSVLASLNSRQSLRDDRLDGPFQRMSTQVTGSTLGIHPVGKSADTQSFLTNSHVIDIKIETITESDVESCNSSDRSILGSDTEVSSVQNTKCINETDT